MTENKSVFKTLFEINVNDHIEKKKDLTYLSWPYAWFTKKPDSDNIIKIVLDGLNKIAYHDDAQICKLSFENRYSEILRVEVKIKKLEEIINMKTTKIYGDEKMVYSGNYYVNTVIFRGKVYDEIKEIKSNGVKFLLQISNLKDYITGNWE